MVLNEGSVQRFVLVSLDDVSDNIVGELDEVFLRSWLGGNKRVKLLGRGREMLTRQTFERKIRGSRGMHRSS